MISHRAVSRLVLNTDYGDFKPEDVFLQLAPTSFDASTFEIWGCLLNGGRLVIPTGERASVEELGEQIEKHQVSVLWLTAGLFHQVVEQALGKLTSVKQLLAGGDVLSVAHVRRVGKELNDVQLINGYGPTENTTFSCCHRMTAEEMLGLGESVPIGAPINNTFAYVLDQKMNPVPIGIRGELYLGGAGLARGYWNNPRLTAEQFVPNPLRGVGERLYRTGDQVRWRNDGRIEFLGRVDDQVKIRGYRIELGEIEARLREQRGVQEAAVVVREEGGEKRVVGYVVGKVGEEVQGMEVRKGMKEWLPEYMVPSVVMVLEEMPLTVNGKVDRGALPVAGIASSEEYVGPETEMEEKMSRIWGEILGREQVGVEENFFEIGGHSLLGTRMMSQVRSGLGVEVPLRALFELPTIRGLAERVEQELKRGGKQKSGEVIAVGRDRDLPLSAAQQRMWFLHQLQPDSTAYNIPLNLQLKGAMDVGILERCVTEIVRRHEVLRTRFVEREGQAEQRIEESREVRLGVVDLSGMELGWRAEMGRHLRQAEAERPFDLGQGPLLRGQVVRLGGEEHELLLSLHHIVGDGWSLEILLRELQALWGAYREGRASPLPELEIQYADFAVWQQGWLQGEVLQQQLAYWRQQLANLPTLDLPTDLQRLQTVDHPRKRHTFSFPVELSGRLKDLSRREGASLFMVLMAGFHWLLGRYANQRDVAVGTVLANRTRKEIEGLIGFFVNTLILRADMRRIATFQELLQRVKVLALEAYEHQDLPFERLVEALNPERDLGRTPLFQAMMVFQNMPVNEWQLPDLHLEVGSSELREAKFELNLTLWEEADSQIKGNIDYAADLFDDESIVQMSQHYRQLLERAVACPEILLWETPILQENESRSLQARWNETGKGKEGGEGESFAELFEEQVKRNGEARAVCYEAVEWSYGELNRRANQLGHYLRSVGAGREKRVGVYLERGLEQVAATLGIWKAGAVYVPLDPAYPKERLGYMLEDARVEVLLTEQALVDELGEWGGRVSCLDLEWERIEQQSEKDIGVKVEGGDLAYVMYTSGSTGRPKGVMVEHGGMVNHLRAKVEDLGLGENDVVAQNAPSSFDISIWQMAAVLLVGGQVQIIGEEIARNGTELLREVDRLGVTVVETVPTLLGIMLEEQEREGEQRLGLHQLRWMISNAEALPVSLCHQWNQLYSHVPLLNTYGATECSDDISHYVLRQPIGKIWTSAPLGDPIGNMQVHILDESMNLMPIGVKGELYLGGTGVGRGYLNRPLVTAQQFVPDPFALRPGARLYRTGDVGRRLRDGSLAFLGRADYQVKIRGHRVELGEIEAALLEHPRVEQAVVLAREDHHSDKRLVAYIVPPKIQQELQPDAGSDQTVANWQKIIGENLTEVLRSFLVTRLPEYLIPTAWVELEALPLTENGKVDRGALLPPAQKMSPTESFAAPRNELEAMLSDIWSQLLHVPHVGIHDNFFALGGHSLMATQVISRVRSILKKEVPLAAVFRSPTLAGLAAEIQQANHQTGARGGVPQIKVADRQAFRRRPASV